MIPSLKTGIDVKYGLLDSDSEGNPIQRNKRTATLKLDNGYNFGQTDPARYTFIYNMPSEQEVHGKPAEWYGNGMHFFEGAFVPTELNSADLSTDQSDDNNTNYTSLTRLLGVPVGCSISATIERIRIPFQHRLSRVIAYVLLDQSMRDQNVTISEISFSRVNVLQSVDANGHPVWVEARKVKPHELGVNRGLDADGKVIPDDGDDKSFVLLHHKKNNTYLAPSSPDYSVNYNSSEYEKVIYTDGAPSYDIIVRPTYTDISTVMYDESGYYNNDGFTKNSIEIQKLADKKNKIEFEIKLSNGLQYTKDFVFDLDANYQTVVYLRIDPEAVNYDNSGTQVWNSTSNIDGFYGVNNGNNNSLSMSGSSWQRAYRTTSAPSGVVITDGSYYDKDDENDHIAGRDGQYLGIDKWKEAFLQAKLNGEHHGDYFILDNDIELDVPAGFVFTGHLDAQGHKIKLVSNSFAGLNGDYEAEVGVANVHSQKGILVPVKGYRAEIINLVVDVDGMPLFTNDATISGYVYHCKYSNGDVITDVIYNGIPSYNNN